jgi:GT2 family glycosyltransferase
MSISATEADRRSLIAAIVVTFDAEERLRECLGSIAAQSRRPDVVFIVNNGSPSIARRAISSVQRSFPDVSWELVQSPMNSGPAGGHFIGLQHALDAGFGRFWVMDDDIVAQPACLAALAIACEAEGGPTIAWPNQTVASGEPQNYPGWYGFLINRAVIDRAGLPDRRLVWWIEDTEYLQHRLPAAGVRSVRVDGVSVLHGDGRPEVEKPAWKIFYETRNVLWYRTRIQRGRHWRKLARAVATLLRSALLSSERRAACRAFLAGTLDGLRGNLDHRWPLPPQQLDLLDTGAPGLRLAAFVMAYRRDEWAVGHVEALLSQSVPPERVLVIDNGRSDDLADLLACFGPAVEYRRMPWNTGPAGAAGAGLLELAGTAEWIYWGDDDQPPAQGALGQQLSLADSCGAAAVAARGWNWDEDRGVLARSDPARAVGDAMLIDVAGGGMTLLLKSSAVSAVGLPTAELFWGFEDIEYLLRMRREQRRIVAPLRRSTSNSRPGRAPAMAFVDLPRNYYTVRNSVYMVVHLHGRPGVGLLMSARALAVSCRGISNGPRYVLRAARFTIAGIFDGWMGLLGSPVALRTERAQARTSVT